MLEAIQSKFLPMGTIIFIDKDKAGMGKTINI
jgi:hypothetical protein